MYVYMQCWDFFLTKAHPSLNVAAADKLCLCNLGTERTH